MQKNRAIFEAFTDGICTIHGMDDDGNAGRVLGTFRYQSRVVGYKRYLESMTEKVRVDKLIRIPFQKWLATEYLAVIDGKVYEIRQVQEIADSRPKTSALTLQHTRKRRAADATV